MLIELFHAEHGLGESDEGTRAFSDLLDRSNAAMVAGMSSFDVARLTKLRRHAERHRREAVALARAVEGIPALAFAVKCARYERESGAGIRRDSLTGGRLALEGRRLGIGGWELLDLGATCVLLVERARSLSEGLGRISPKHARELSRGADRSLNAAMADGIASAVLDVPGVNGTVLALLAVFWGLEPPFARPDGRVAIEQWETRRKRWDERLRHARRKRKRTR
jgi:hypothetical protein